MEGDSISATSSRPEQQQPLLRSFTGGIQPPPVQSNGVAVLPSRAGGHRSSPSDLVRETAAMQLEERRADWAYSRPVVVLDISWNLAFAVFSAVMLAVTVSERPNVPVRLWVAGYAVQCVFHVVLVCSEYRRRRAVERRDGGDGEMRRGNSGALDREEEGDDGGIRFNLRSSFAKRCDSLNTMASFLWWIIGFYWLISGGDILLQHAPRLYWLAVVFLAFDVFFAIFCVALACVIGIALCCCLPCIIAILYAVAGQNGASDADISMLPRYKYAEPCGNGEKMSEEGAMIPMTSNSGSSSDERVLLREDAVDVETQCTTHIGFNVENTSIFSTTRECCICLSPYEDGVELNSLPCNHHFHSACVVNWLRINATCPLCKYDILKDNDCV